MLLRLPFSRNATLMRQPKNRREVRFGMEDGSEHTLEEVGRAFSVTRERIRQIEAQALSKLRHPSRSHRAHSHNARSDPEENIHTAHGVLGKTRHGRLELRCYDDRDEPRHRHCWWRPVRT